MGCTQSVSKQCEDNIKIKNQDKAKIHPAENNNDNSIDTDAKLQQLKNKYGRSKNQTEVKQEQNAAKSPPKIAQNPRIRNITTDFHRMGDLDIISKQNGTPLSSSRQQSPSSSTKSSDKNQDKFMFIKQDIEEHQEQ